MESETRPFPFRQMLAGELRNKTEAEVLAACGEPDERDGDIWIWREGRDLPEGTLGDPRTVHVQFWFQGGTLAHAWLRLIFADGLDYQEVLF